jgi:hypothetical protein
MNIHDLLYSIHYYDPLSGLFMNEDTQVDQGASSRGGLYPNGRCEAWEFSNHSLWLPWEVFWHAKSRYTRLTSAFAPHEHGRGRDWSLVMPAIDTFACEAVTVPNWLFGDRPLQTFEASGRSARDRACHCPVLHFASRLQIGSLVLQFACRTRSLGTISFPECTRMNVFTPI